MLQLQQEQNMLLRRIVPDGQVTTLYGLLNAQLSSGTIGLNIPEQLSVIREQLIQLRTFLNVQLSPGTIPLNIAEQLYIMVQSLDIIRGNIIAVNGYTMQTANIMSGQELPYATENPTVHQLLKTTSDDLAKLYNCMFPDGCEPDDGGGTDPPFVECSVNQTFAEIPYGSFNPLSSTLYFGPGTSNGALQLYNGDAYVWVLNMRLIVSESGNFSISPTIFGVPTAAENMPDTWVSYVKEGIPPTALAITLCIDSEMVGSAVSNISFGVIDGAFLGASGKIDDAGDRLEFGTRVQNEELSNLLNFGRIEYHDYHVSSPSGQPISAFDDYYNSAPAYILYIAALASDVEANPEIFASIHQYVYIKLQG
jgi:hypothetical protein